MSLVTVQNEFDRGVFNRDRDDIKVLPYISQTADNIKNNDKNEYDKNNLINIVLKIMRTLLDRCQKSTVILIIFFFRTVV